MSLFARLNAAQKSRRFKLIATGVVVGLWLLGVAWIWVAANRPDAQITPEAARTAAQSVAPRSGPLTAWVERGPIALLQQGFDTLKRTMRTGQGSAMVVLGTGIVAGASVLIIWLGLGLGYLALMVVGWGIAWPLTAMESTRSFGQVLLGVVPLTLFFLMLMEALKLALSGPQPFLAIARNVLNEAVRMKISLVFIIMVILFLALVPGALNENQPLRYRVQQWMQYGTGFSYAILAMLTLFLSAATVAFEQRDKIIWQTMTKPVPHWQYLFGKWLGVMALNAVLLTVTAAGVYIFTEYLSHQRARGEIAYLIREDGRNADPNGPQMDEMVNIRMGQMQEEFKKDGKTYPDTPQNRAIIRRQLSQEFMSDDRRLLELQVLAARVGVKPEKPEISGDELAKVIDQRVRDTLALNTDMRDTPALRAKITDDTLKELAEQARAVAPGFAREFTFKGLNPARDRKQQGELTFRYKVNAGSNNPSDIYRIMFIINGSEREFTTTLKTMQSISIEPELLNDAGELKVQVHSHPDNHETMVFPPDGLEVLYTVGGYEANFVRIIAVLLVKLGFVAAVAIAAATFLSFPVACLVAICVLFAAESAGFLQESLDIFYGASEKGEIKPFNILVRMVAMPISWFFAPYADLDPTTSLVDGRLLSWGKLLKATATIGGWTLGSLFIGWAVFRRRELATYSGH